MQANNLPYRENEEKIALYSL